MKESALVALLGVILWILAGCAEHFAQLTFDRDILLLTKTGMRRGACHCHTGEEIGVEGRRALWKDCTDMGKLVQDKDLNKLTS